MGLTEVADRDPLQCAHVAPYKLGQLLQRDLLTTKERVDRKAMSPQNLCIEIAPFLAASRDSKEVAGSHAACDTVSGSCGKFVPGLAARLLTKRGFRDQTKAGLAGLKIASSTEQCRCDFGIYRLLGQQCDTKVGFAWHLTRGKWRTEEDSNPRPPDS